MTLFSWHGHSRLFINFCTCFSTLPPSEAFTSTQINVSCCGSILISPFAYPIPLPLPAVVPAVSAAILLPYPNRKLSSWYSRWWTRQSTSELWFQPIAHPMQMWLTAALRLQPPSAVFFLFSRTLRFIQKGSSRFMPKSWWQSYYSLQGPTPKSQILQIKSSYYHSCLDPSSADCSNHFLLQQAFAQVPGLLLPSQLMSKNRLKYLGHILRHRPALSTISVSIIHFLSVPSRHHFAVVPQEHTGQKLPYSGISVSSKLLFQ